MTRLQRSLKHCALDILCVFPNLKRSRKPYQTKRLSAKYTKCERGERKWCFFRRYECEIITKNRRIDFVHHCSRKENRSTIKTFEKAGGIVVRSLLRMGWIGSCETQNSKIYAIHRRRNLTFILKIMKNQKQRKK
jgi:hypothetical protein